ncbi:MAG TPA: carbamoyltransferase N-terminal domain-containing protein [Gemmataceae bacterium]|nr:carbamoyltransferase N-terminal domain-containing protein [Gemmataceae bacterium]
MVTAILGISAFYHDSAAALVIDGEIVAAAQEERFTREKFDARFPSQAIAYCLQEAGLTADQLDYVAFYDKPLTKFERLLETYLGYAPRGFKSFRMAMPLWLKKKLFMRREIRKGFPDSIRAALVFLDHHESHAASAFFPSPFDEAAILTLDGVGEWSTATYGTGSGNRLRLTHHLQFPHSLGLLYSAFTYYCGFKVNSGEYKLMGLAPYGQPVYQDLIYQHLVDLKPDGSLRLNMDYFNYCQGLTMTNERFHRLFGGPPRKPDTKLEQRHMDLAASIQKVTEEVLLRMGRELHRQTGLKNLVLAGGVALNCVANGRLLREGPFENIWIQPAAGDAGGALGAALFVWYQLLDRPRRPMGRDSQKASLLGPQYSCSEIEKFLNQTGARYRRFADEAELLDHVVQAMIEEKVVGWFHGRMEFGPRALGARSIIGDPRSPRMQAVMNLKVKFRESFRPFAPCVLREHVHEWFGMRPNEDSPYMLLVAPVLEKHRLPLSKEDEEAMRTDPDLMRRVNIPRSTVPAITHVDYSARAQTVDERHGRFYRLMKKFHEKTGCPIIVNTSFNLSWEPIVMTPQEAYHTFMQSEMDVLVLEDFVLHKAEQPLGLTVWATPQKKQAVLEGREDLDPDSPWADPLTGDPLVMTADEAVNPRTGARYPVVEGIPRLFVPTEGTANGQDVTEIVKQFYEKTPFPNYDDLDNHRALLEKARSGLFARLLNEQIPYNARVVEIGCGTGQLTNFLAIAHRSVIGVDVCLNSLRLAQNFKTEHGLDRATFAQMNLFRPGLKDGFFDVVISNGVLHHTADCRGAFHRISRLARPGGLVVVGLYNAYSRKLHYARRALFRWTGLTGRWLDPHFGKMSASGKREAWFQDQYCHPHETCHTIDEVLGWMDECGLEFLNSIPKPVPGPALTADERLFAPHDRGTALSRVLSQLAAMPNGYREGGFFIMIGRRRPEEAI